MSNNIISVILPVYNGAKFLQKSIESILNQSISNFELIIINDGSKDDSIKIINDFSARDERIIVVNRENRGLIYSLNEAISMSSCDYIARMDQDDIAEKDRLKLQYDYMLKNDLDICGGDFSTIDENNQLIKEYKLQDNPDGILLTLASNVPFPHPSVMMKKEFLTLNNLKYGKNGKREAEDLDLWLQMYDSGAKFGNLDKQVLKYRILNTSMSRINHKKMVAEKHKQFDDFMMRNKHDYTRSFYCVFSNKNEIVNEDLKKITVKASLRYFMLFKDVRILYKSMVKAGFWNSIIGTLSYIKSKY